MKWIQGHEGEKRKLKTREKKADEIEKNYSNRQVNINMDTKGSKNTVKEISSRNVVERNQY